MFFFKKLLGNALAPLPFCLLLLLLALALLCSKRFQTWGKGLLAVTIVLLYLVSVKPFSTPLLANIERTYPAITEAPANTSFVMVLGSGHDSDPALPLHEQASESAYYRFNHAFALLQQLPDAKLIVSGAHGSDPISHAEYNRRRALDWGVEADRIIQFDAPKDTVGEARAAKHIAGDQPLLLVTSASHMRRALALFHGQGVNAVPAPTRFLARPDVPMNYQDWIPRSNHLLLSERLIHEQLGLWWARLKGQNAAP